MRLGSSKTGQSKYHESFSVDREVLAHGPKDFADDCSVSVILHASDVRDPFSQDAMLLCQRDKKSLRRHDCCSAYQQP
jgi:hypothetical protein